MKKKAVITIAVCVGVWAVWSAVTPVLKKYDDGFPDAFNDHVLHERVKTFPAASSAPESGDGEGLFVLPDWVPEDAEDVKVKVQTDGNAKLLRFTLGSKPLKPRDKDCPKAAFSGAPKLEAGWWPQDVGDGDGRSACADLYQYRVVSKGDDVYAWTNGDPAHI